MLKWYAKKFELACEILNILIFIGFAITGGVYAYSIRKGRWLYYDDSIMGYRDETFWYVVLFVLIGLVLAFVVNILVFGFIGQFIEMRKQLEDYNNKN